MLQASQPHLDFLFFQQGPWGQGPHHLPALPVKKEGKGGSLTFQEMQLRKQNGSEPGWTLGRAGGREVQLQDGGHTAFV